MFVGVRLHVSGSGLTHVQPALCLKRCAWGMPKRTKARSPPCCTLEWVRHCPFFKHVPIGFSGLQTQARGAALRFMDHKRPFEEKRGEKTRKETFNALYSSLVCV
uniref:Uncharacterized protein n=1 Tax=Opuntia streptacantha TaxID=393608 RepID=A0A7C9A1P8_OPUST